LGRSFDPTLNAYPDDVAYRMVMFSVDETTLQALIAESRAGTASDDQLRASILPQDLPIFVLTADGTIEELEGWENAQAQLAALSSNSVWEIVPNSVHNLHAVQPAAVTDAINRVWEAAASGLPLNEESAS
jgi:pimeloyl-ACP methyl ester carboxylesterase